MPLPRRSLSEFQERLDVVVSDEAYNKFTSSIGGDITIDIVSESAPKSDFYIIFYGGILKLHNKSPPRITPVSATALDLLFTSQTGLPIVSGRLVTDMSDHLLVFFVVERKFTMNSMRMPNFGTTTLIIPQALEKSKDSLKDRQL